MTVWERIQYAPKELFVVVFFTLSYNAILAGTLTFCRLSIRYIPALQILKPYGKLLNLLNLSLTPIASQVIGTLHNTLC